MKTKKTPRKPPPSPVPLPPKRWSKTAQCWLYPVRKGTRVLWVSVPESER